MTRTWLIPPLTAAGILLSLMVGRAQRPQSAQPAQRAQQGESANVNAIVVDVTVRDHAGNPVTDLTAQDFELYEDGARQEIGSMTPINTASPGAAANAGTPAGATPRPSAPAKQAPQVMALVFDRLSPEGRAFARKASLGYIGESALADNTIAVYGIDLSILVYQGFTRDANHLRAAIEAAGVRSTSQYGSTRTDQNAAAEQAQRSQVQADAASAAAGGPGGTGGSDIGGAASAAQFAQMQERMLQSFDALERDQQGYATSNALLAIVSSMKAIPGRKSVIFFSEGLSIPPNVQRQFISVIDAANRANVTIYPMDAAGLRTDSTLKETREGIQSASRERIEVTLTRPMNDRPMMEALERNETLLRADPHSGLGTLADQTGGFLIANSNDLRGGFQRIDTDMRNYYVLTYVPGNTRYDGKFREIDVKVRRSGVQVRARKGYYAVRPTTSGTPLLSYEAPALAVLEQSPVPNAFTVRAVALRFPEQGRTNLVPVLVNVPTAGISFRPTADKKSYASDFIVLVRFKDDTGQVLEKLSQHYQIGGPIEQLDHATTGDVLFYRQPVLYPGVFTMETVVYDALASKASVRVQTVDVPAIDGSLLRMSSVVAIRRSEKVPEQERIAGSPLYVGEQLLYPNMGDPFSKATTKELPFYFVAYPAKGSGDTKATIELLNNGQRVAQAPLQLAAADTQGRIAQVSRIPLDALQPGGYELRVTLQQGTKTASRILSFKVTP